MKSVVCMCVVTGALCLMAAAGAAPAGTLGVQDFEVNTDGFVNYGGVIERVKSNTGGVVSAGGVYHAEITMTADPSNGDGASADGGAYVGTSFAGRDGVVLSPGFGTFRYSVDVYIDPGAGAVGDFWSQQSYFKIYDTADATGDYRTLGQFTWSATKLDGQTWRLGRTLDENDLNITTAGWYTLETDWVDGGDGSVYNYNRVVSAGGDVLWGADPLQSSVTNHPWDEGASYAPSTCWFFSRYDTTPVLPIDNLAYEQIAPVPEPLTMIGLGVGLAGLGDYLRRRRA